MVVQNGVAHQCLLHVLVRHEAVRVQHITDTAIKALHHAAVLNAQGFAQLVKLMIATRLTLMRGKQTVSEFFAVVRQ